MRRLLTVLAVLLALTVCAAAYEIPEDFTGMTLEEAVNDFMAAHDLTEDNFSVSYYNTCTEESYAFNEKWFSIAASTYKLPLNMYFYEMQQAGELTGDTVITWTGRTLDEIHYESIVNSNNELSEALMWYWGDHQTYKQNMRRYFTMPDEQISHLYWQANWYCVEMMMDALKYLWENRESFEELIGLMKQGMPNGYFRLGVTEYEVAHKYGAVQWYNNDVGIIYTPQPFLLAVYHLRLHDDGLRTDRICAETAKLMTAWNVWQAEQNPLPEPAVEEEPPQTVPGQQELTVEQLPPQLRAPEEAQEPVQPQRQESAAPMAVPVPAGRTTDLLPIAAIAVLALGLSAALIVCTAKKK